MEQLTTTQLSEWEAYDRLEPVGRQRDDYRTALLCSVVTNIARAIWHKKGSTLQMTSPADFLPQWAGKEGSSDTPPKKQSVEEMKSFLQSLVSHSKGKK